MPSIFTRIINGEIPCYKVAENDHCLAFLDIGPLKEGHTLVVPKKEVDDLFQLDDASYRELLMFTKKVAAAIQDTIACKRVCVSVLGFEVPHAHIHLIPANSESDPNFRNPKVNMSKEQFEQTAKKISAAFKA
jgi:histidine triad (HIT) family protein